MVLFWGGGSVLHANLHACRTHEYVCYYKHLYNIIGFYFIIHREFSERVLLELIQASFLSFVFFSFFSFSFVYFLFVLYIFHSFHSFLHFIFILFILVLFIVLFVLLVIILHFVYMSKRVFLYRSNIFPIPIKQFHNT